MNHIVLLFIKTNFLYLRFTQMIHQCITYYVPCNYQDNLGENNQYLNNCL